MLLRQFKGNRYMLGPQVVLSIITCTSTSIIGCKKYVTRTTTDVQVTGCTGSSEEIKRTALRGGGHLYSCRNTIDVKSECEDCVSGFTLSETKCIPITPDQNCAMPLMVTSTRMQANPSCSNGTSLCSADEIYSYTSLPSAGGVCFVGCVLSSQDNRYCGRCKNGYILSLTGKCILGNVGGDCGNGTMVLSLNSEVVPASELVAITDLYIQNIAESSPRVSYPGQHTKLSLFFNPSGWWSLVSGEAELVRLDTSESNPAAHVVPWSVPAANDDWVAVPGLILMCYDEASGITSENCSGATLHGNSRCRYCPDCLVGKTAAGNICGSDGEGDCISCPSGSYSSSRSPSTSLSPTCSACGCPAGTYLQTTCTASSTAECKSCPPGKFVSAAIHMFTQCTTANVCSSGFYQAAPSTVSSDVVCTPCGPGENQPATNHQISWCQAATVTFTAENGQDLSAGIAGASLMLIFVAVLALFHREGYITVAFFPSCARTDDFVPELHPSSCTSSLSEMVRSDFENSGSEMASDIDVSGGTLNKLVRTQKHIQNRFTVLSHKKDELVSQPAYSQILSHPLSVRSATRSRPNSGSSRGSINRVGPTQVVGSNSLLTRNIGLRDLQHSYPSTPSILSRTVKDYDQDQRSANISIERPHMNIVSSAEESYEQSLESIAGVSHNIHDRALETQNFFRMRSVSDPPSVVNDSNLEGSEAVMTVSRTTMAEDANSRANRSRRRQSSGPEAVAGGGLSRGIANPTSMRLNQSTGTLDRVGLTRGNLAAHMAKFDPVDRRKGLGTGPCTIQKKKEADILSEICKPGGGHYLPSKASTQITAKSVQVDDLGENILSLGEPCVQKT